MISISKALRIIKQNTPSGANEKVVLPDGVDRILAEEIVADMDLPPFDRSQMDGFAVKTRDIQNAPATLKIVGESVAGKGWHDELKTGEAVRIMTGAPVPRGADSVQKVELTCEVADEFIEVREATKLGQNIVSKSAEISKGTKVFAKGDRITNTMVATLASFGYEEVLVAKRPRVSILATGTEIVDISETPSTDQIRNSNSWSLRAFADRIAEVKVLPIAKDDLANLKTNILEALEDCDCLIISGGVSVGDYDFTKPALREIGAEILFEKITLKPGKPTVFAKFNDKLIFGLPGNPVSVAVTFLVFVRMALLKMQNANSIELKKGFAKVSHEIKGTKGRDSMLPVSLEIDHSGTLLIETLRFSGSSNFITFARAEALCFIPKDTILNKNEVAEIYFLL